VTTLSTRSPAFAPGGPIPRKFTCDGDDVSPPLEWDPGPAGTASYALIMDDPDAPRGTWVHWVAWGIHATNLPEGASPRGRGGFQEGLNSWPRRGYGGPCPPSGTHRYYFRLYALDAEVAPGAKADKAALLKAMEGHVLAQGELMGRYARQDRTR
jgi:hypothetical protein